MRWYTVTLVLSRGAKRKDGKTSDRANCCSVQKWIPEEPIFSVAFRGRLYCSDTRAPRLVTSHQPGGPIHPRPAVERGHCCPPACSPAVQSEVWARGSSPAEGARADRGRRHGGLGRPRHRPAVPGGGVGRHRVRGQAGVRAHHPRLPGALQPVRPRWRSLLRSVGRSARTISA